MLKISVAAKTIQEILIIIRGKANAVFNKIDLICPKVHYTNYFRKAKKEFC